MSNMNVLRTKNDVTTTTINQMAAAVCQILTDYNKKHDTFLSRKFPDLFANKPLQTALSDLAEKVTRISDRPNHDSDETINCFKKFIDILQALRSFIYKERDAMNDPSYFAVKKLLIRQLKSQTNAPINEFKPEIDAQITHAVDQLSEFI